MDIKAKSVKFKNYNKIKQMVRNGEVDILGSSEDGEIIHLCVPGGHVLNVWHSDLGEDVLVVDSGNAKVINESMYERFKVLFEE